jgi:hypothetical protein
MSAAIEASIENIPSIGFSLLNYSLEGISARPKNTPGYLLRKS